MKKIIVKKPGPTAETVYLEDVYDGTPIFAKINGRLVGMVVNEKEGWITRIGGPFGSSGFFENREDCIKAGMVDSTSKEYFVEED